MIADREQIVADDHWLPRRELFDVLYSTPRAIPYLHAPCARGPRSAQYLRRGEDGGVVCPTCADRVAPALVASLGMLGPTP